MTTESVLKKSWDVFVKHWQYFALVALIVFGINLVLGLLISGSIAGGLGGIAAGAAVDDLSLTTIFSGAGLASLGVGALVSFLVAPWLYGANAHAGKLALDGKTDNAWRPFNDALAQYLTFLLLIIVVSIALVVGFVIFIIPGIILAVLLSLSPMAVAVDGAGVADALRTSWNMGLKHFWTIFLVGLIVAALMFILSITFGLIPFLGQYIGSVVTVFGALTLAVMYKQAK